MTTGVNQLFVDYHDLYSSNYLPFFIKCSKDYFPIIWQTSNHICSLNFFLLWDRPIDALGLP